LARTAAAAMVGSNKAAAADCCWKMKKSQKIRTGSDVTLSNKANHVRDIARRLSLRHQSHDIDSVMNRYIGSPPVT